ncbi:unnamed protein product, partial [Scytosiphon promiscuus]
MIVASSTPGQKPYPSSCSLSLPPGHTLPLWGGVRVLVSVPPAAHSSSRLLAVLRAVWLTAGETPRMAAGGSCGFFSLSPCFPAFPSPSSFLSHRAAVPTRAPVVVMAVVVPSVVAFPGARHRA